MDNVGEALAPIGEHLRKGGEFVLEKESGELRACAGPHGTYAIVGKEADGSVAFSQGAARLAQILDVMEQQAPLLRWKARGPEDAS